MTKKIECSVCSKRNTTMRVIDSWDKTEKIPVCSDQCLKEALDHNALIQKINDQMEADWNRRQLSKNI